MRGKHQRRGIARAKVGKVCFLLSLSLNLISGKGTRLIRLGTRDQGEHVIAEWRAHRSRCRERMLQEKSLVIRREVAAPETRVAAIR